MLAKPSILDQLTGTASQFLRVLLLENNPDHAELIHHALLGPEECFRLEVCSTRTEFVEKARIESYDALLVDYHAPEADHLEILAEVRRAAIASPVIFISGSDNEETITQILRAGAADFVIKTRTSLKTLPVVVKRSIIRTLGAKPRHAKTGRLRLPHDPFRLEESLQRISRISRNLARKIADQGWSKDDHSRLKLLESLFQEVTRALKGKKQEIRFFAQPRKKRPPTADL